MSAKRTQQRTRARARIHGAAHTRQTAARVGDRLRWLLLAVLVLVSFTGCDVAQTHADAARIEAEADRATAQGNADAARIQAEADAEAAVLEAEARAIEAEAAANEAKAASTEALAVLEQAQGDRSMKEAIAAQVDGITGVLTATTATLRTLAVAVVALVVIFAFGVGGMLFISWRGQQQTAQTQMPGRYILVQDPQAVLGQERTALMPADLRPIERSVRRG